MQSDIIAIAIAYILGVAVRVVGLPPLVGYLFAGFGLYASGGQLTPTLKEFSEIGVTLLLFSIGLKLRPSSLLMPQIWAVASLHMLLSVVAMATFILTMAFLGISLFTHLDPLVIALLAFALSFSSTVFAVKILEEKGEMNSLYGRISIGILIVQDIAAVIFLVFSTAKIPSVWALGLVALIPMRRLLYRLLERSGHGELLILFGLTLALGGAQLFELLSIKGDLGALILGVMLASHARAPELARQLLGFKDLFLVGFFLSIGLSGPLSWNAVAISLLLLLLVPFKTFLFFGLFSKFRLRARTSFLASLSLANYSEFGLIVVAVSVSNGWLDREWLIIMAIALSLSFILAAPLNGATYHLYAHLCSFLSRFERPQRISEEEDINPGDTGVIIFGMGRVGSGAYDAMRKRMGEQVLGVDIDEDIVKKQKASGRRVIRGSATDPDFWTRICLDFERVSLILLAMPNAQENLRAARQLKDIGYTGQVAAVAKYADEIEALQKAGVHAAFNLYAEAGAGFAEHVCHELLSESS
ncbi:Putative glutathione-regulated potassium-efflux system protein KefB [hydrothermal vent metagenome]|uniref:Glutathione-regulated potassium-efflux system protein KefB n=1 Tax=hydrothermal vent metagenome TaxID=652676 RepID=A0A3B1BTI7_9ZZZZ